MKKGKNTTHKIEKKIGEKKKKEIIGTNDENEKIKEEMTLRENRKKEKNGKIWKMGNETQFELEGAR